MTLMNLVPEAPGGHVTPAKLEVSDPQFLLPSCSGFFTVPQHYTIQNPSSDRKYLKLMVMDSSASPSGDIKFAEFVNDCSLWVPIDVQNGTFNEQRDLSVSMTLIHTCTSFLTSTHTATTEILTVSPSGKAAESQTETVPASTETWQVTVVETTVVMVPSITMIVTNGVTSEVCPACSQSTASPSRFVKHLHHGLWCKFYGISHPTCNSISETDPVQS
jgi:hypothetical protein